MLVLLATQREREIAMDPESSAWVWERQQTDRVDRAAGRKARLAEGVRSAFVQRLAAEHGFVTSPAVPLPADGHRPHFFLSSTHARSLEALSLLLALRDLKTNHIVFHLASLEMVTSSRRLLSEYARLLHRHRRLRLHIESHTGVGAPPQIAPQHSVRRACAVSKWLISRGVPVRQLSACAWGQDIGIAHDWPASSAYARCELFLALEQALPQGSQQAAGQTWTTVRTWRSAQTS